MVDPVHCGRGSASLVEEGRVADANRIDDMARQVRVVAVRQTSLGDHDDGPSMVTPRSHRRSMGRPEEVGSSGAAGMGERGGIEGGGGERRKWEGN